MEEKAIYCTHECLSTAQGKVKRESFLVTGQDNP